LIVLPGGHLTLVFESFAFKRGIPTDADYVFDARMLPNPHYEPELKALTGRDEPVIAFFQHHDEVRKLMLHIAQFLDAWLDSLSNDNRSYVTVAIGCTGGQHRSVYLVEELTRLFADRWTTLCRHRELDATPGRTRPPRSAGCRPEAATGAPAPAVRGAGHSLGRTTARPSDGGEDRLRQSSTHRMQMQVLVCQHMLEGRKIL
jgi:hypothetical protein